MPTQKIRLFPLAIVVALVATGAMIYANLPAPAPVTTEQNLIALVDHYRQVWKNNTNDMDDPTIRKDRARALCELLSKPMIGQFTGTVADVGLAMLPNMNKQIDAYIEIRLADHLEFTTDHNDPLGKGTNMFAPGSALYAEARSLQKNESVIFRGQYLSDPKDCLEETSMTETGGMTDPEFLFRFSSITPAGQ